MANIESDQNPSGLPRLKHSIEAMQINHEGRPMVLLKDQEGLIEQSLLVSHSGFLVALMLNGITKKSEIVTQFSQATGSLIKEQEIDDLINQLDANYLLETPHLNKRRQEVWQEFKNSKVRKPRFMNTVYPSKTIDLALEFGKYFQDSKGPGQSQTNKTEELLGIVAPHIDFHRGGPLYAWTYQYLLDTDPPDVIIALGVAHAMPKSPWVFSKKAYETPYGAMGVDENLIEDLSRCLWYNPFEEEGAHRIEHSLEFQAVWLKYVWKEKTPPWIPILCSSFYEYASDKPPSQIATIDEGIKKMGEVLLSLQKKGKKILIVAGIDLSHVGPRFGDKEDVSPDTKKRIEENDKHALDLVLKGNADQFYMAMIKDGFWQKVCGLSAMYTASKLMNILNPAAASKGTLLAYDMAEDPAGGVVSYASAIFPKKNIVS